jgi:hypothetical protein
VEGRKGREREREKIKTERRKGLKNKDINQ